MNWKEEVTHPRTGVFYRIVPLAQLNHRSARVAELVEICNQPDIYRLFVERFLGAPYAEKDAEWFLNWSEKGWIEGTHFVFVALAPDGSIAAASDVKSANRDDAEIGYWCSKDHLGITPELVRSMERWAKAKGFKRWFAVPTNPRSKALLQKLEFSYRGPHEQHALGVFEKTLSPPSYA